MDRVIQRSNSILLNNKTRGAIEDWLEQGERINLSLRNNTEEFTSTVRELVQLVRSVRVEEEFTLYRGCEWICDITGRERTNTFVSLTSDREIADRFGPLTSLRITKGTPIYYISASDSLYEEDEFLLYNPLIERQRNHLLVKE